jgi:hypothetical protein
MRTIYTINSLTHKCLLGIFIAMLTIQCGSQKEKENDSQEQRQQVLAVGKKLGNQIYQKLISQDSLNIAKCFHKELYKDINEFIKMLEARHEDWGEFHSFNVSDVTVNEKYFAKGDTVSYQIKVNAIYDFNESWDEFTLQKINNDEFKVIAYDFDPELMLNCGINALEEVKPDYMDYSRAIFENDTAVIWKMCKQDNVFYNEIINLQNDFFPQGSKCDSIVFNTGYMRKYCGKKGEANGMMIFTVYYNDTTYLDIIYKVDKSNDDEEFNTYSIYFTGDLIVDDEKDVEFVKNISKEVSKMIQKNDVAGVINTFHSELKSLYTTETLKEISEIVEDLKSLGKFEGYYDYHTFRTQDKEFNYYIVILELVDEDGVHNYLEMVFKPDSNKKLMLLTLNEMLD